MGNAVTSVLEALERYVGPYVPVILDRVFPSENKREQEKQEMTEWKQLTEQLEELLVEMRASTVLLTQLRQHPDKESTVVLHAVADA